MSSSRSNLVSLKKETAEAFSLTQIRKDGSIDLKMLADKARSAIDGSERSLAVAEGIAGSGWLARQWNSGEFAKNVVESIGYIRDISQVNLALSAVCNDLAAANLQHAQKIDANHCATSQQLQAVQQLTSALLEHLQEARDSSLLQPIVLGLSEVDAADKEALQGWLHSFSQAIDKQYLKLQERVTQFEHQRKFSPDVVDKIQTELGRLDASLQTQKAEITCQFDELNAQMMHQVELVVAERSQAFDTTLRQSHEKLSKGLILLNERLDGVKLNLETERNARKEWVVSMRQLFEQREQRIHLTLATGLDAERKAREEGISLMRKLFEKREQTMQHALNVGLHTERKAREDHGAFMLQSLEHQEQAIRKNINALNRQWLKRLFWVGGVLLSLQVASLVYFTGRIGGG